MPLTGEQLDAILTAAARDNLSHLELVHRLVAELAQQRRERSIARRIGQARFKEHKTLATFDWEFNAKALDRVQIEELATGAFIGRCDNLVFVGQSGVGKSHLIQAIGLAACVHYRVRYVTSARLLQELNASLADHSLAKKVSSYANVELLIIDEFGLEKIERTEIPHAASLLYKVIDARSQRYSTALVSNIDFDAWGEYLGDAQLTMPLLDRVVDGAIILKINGKSYRAHRARKRATP
ncbi:MAG: IS21-like element helper ATPase IstB [Terriglobales bacterium]